MGILEVEIPGQATYIGHEGDAFGYQAFVLLDPGTGTSVVVANNTCGLPILMSGIIGALPLGK